MDAIHRQLLQSLVLATFQKAAELWPAAYEDARDDMHLHALMTEDNKLVDLLKNPAQAAHIISSFIFDMTRGGSGHTLKEPPLGAYWQEMQALKSGDMNDRMETARELIFLLGHHKVWGAKDMQGPAIN